MTDVVNEYNQRGMIIMVEQESLLSEGRYVLQGCHRLIKGT